MTDERPRTDDELLSAFVDDALPAGEAEQVRRRLAEEPAFARRLSELRRVDLAMHAAYARIADEPLPRRVTDRLRAPAGVAAFRPRATTSRWFGLPSAVAASLALAAGFLVALLVLPRAGSVDPLGALATGGVVSEGSSLHEVLHAAPSGESRRLGTTWSATPRLTFMSRDGAPCRRVDVTGEGSHIEALACRRRDAWHVEFLGLSRAEPGAGEDAYRPAAGTPSRIDAVIDTVIDGSPLGREAEQSLISGDWHHGQRP